jgi:hypothetical protein
MAAAKTLPVSDSSQRTVDLGQVTGQTWSYAFSAQSFDVTTDGASPKAVHYFRQLVSYDVESAPGGFWTATIGGSWLGNVFHVSTPPTRTYQTSLQWNGTAWLNATTTFTLGGGSNAFSWQVCNHVSYTWGTTTFGATKECDTKYWGGNPTHLSHSFQFGNITLGGQNANGWTLTFTGSHVVDQTFTSLDLLIPTTSAPTWTFSVTSSAAARSGDIAHVSVDYLATTNDNFAAIDAGAIRASCDGFDCLIIKAANSIFGVMDHVLTLIFDKLSSGTTQGHDTAARTAEAITSLLAIFIGIPTTLTALFLLHPGKSFLALSDYLLVLGIVRWASSPVAEVSVIWTTPLKFWGAVGRGIVAFVVWLWGLVERMFQAILHASPITLMIIGGLVLGTAIGALIVKLAGG